MSTTESWPEPVARVAAAIAAEGAEARIHQFREGTPTAEAAATAVGCDLEQIVKSLVFWCDATPVLVMVSGLRRADSERVREACGAEAARIARPEHVLELTGFEVGGVAPFPLPNIQVALIDASLLGHELVWCGAGSRSHMVGLSPEELVRLTRARPAEIGAD